MGGGGDTSKNPPEDAQKIFKMLTLTWPKSSLKNAIKLGFFSTFILNHLTLVLTLSWRRPISCRNQSIHLHSKSMDRFQYDSGLRLERVNMEEEGALTPPRGVGGGVEDEGASC